YKFTEALGSGCGGPARWSRMSAKYTRTINLWFNLKVDCFDYRRVLAMWPGQVAEIGLLMQHKRGGRAWPDM
ncbi:hypothetical protein J6590_094923, partial [Homalodisca vitripennis]